VGTSAAAAPLVTHSVAAILSSRTDTVTTASRSWKPDAAPPIPRRAVVALLGASGAALGALAGVIAYLTPHRTGERDVGSVADFAVGEIRHFKPNAEGNYLPIDDSTRPNQCDLGRKGFLVLRRPDGFVALSDRCTHTGASVLHRAVYTKSMVCGGPVGGPMTCTSVAGLMPSGRTDSLECPCHSSTFDPHNGEVVYGPAPRPLDALPVPVTIQSGRVIVNVAPDHPRIRQPGDPLSATAV
jgi:Rieske Fe-S protein